MPRRTVTRCARRGVAADELDQLVEHNLVHGDCFDVFDLDCRADFARPWAVWRDEITRRWSAAYPGSRPMAAYLLGEIEPPAWVHELPALRRPMRPIRGISIELPDTGWHRLAPELVHLAAIGIVGDDEYGLAVERLDSGCPLAPRYQAIAGR